MKIMSPKLWMILHENYFVDGVVSLVAYWHTNTPKEKWLIIMDAGLLALLLFLFATFQGGQS